MTQMSNEQFAAFITQYKVNMYRLALGMLHQEADAQDAVSEAVIKAYENIDSLRSTSKFKPWIMQIVANEARKIYRFQKRSECVADMEVFHLSHEDEHHELWDIVIKLDKQYREVIILFFYDRLQIKEIGKILHISEGTVKSRLFRAKKLLKNKL